MRCYNLNIADYNIRIEAPRKGLDLIPGKRFQSSITSGPVTSDILLRVHPERYSIPDEAREVFDAPLVEEIGGKKNIKTDNFWSIYKFRDDLLLKTIFPYSDRSKKGILKFSLAARDWDLYLEGAGEETDPLDYPVDGLLLYYLTVMKGDIMIHASGVNHSGHGYLFSGTSGSGKTTMAKLWDKAGARVIHDDRLIIRNIAGSYKMYNTPIYMNDIPTESPLTRIYLIEHGKENSIVPITGATAASQVLANCIQHNWDPGIVAGMMGSLSIMCSGIPTVKLKFKPDRSIIDFILDYEW
jgi:hypothetical protein